MRTHIRRRHSISARWSVRIAFLAVILFVLSGLGHRFERIETPEFLWLLAIVGTMAILALLLAMKGFTSLWRRGDIGFSKAFWGAIVALLVLVPFATTLYQILALPTIYDVSTDIVDPPSLFAASGRTERMNPLVSDRASRQLQTAAYPQVTGRRYDGSPDRILTAVKTVIANNGWTIVQQKGEPGEDEEILVQVVARTWLLGFTSDVAIRLSDESETTYVDMRSVSRYGIHDLGENADRIAAFMTALDAEVQGAQPEEETTRSPAEDPT
ncbi:DUF1499 domain-containing protein [Phyllobacterium sp. 21LDTY02-6]|uniref:DUF1499 domain-containing protein n=1 Tax=unclassified Phyllobacterium TaxID=2638441 RepID=UPI00201FD07E|nr:MULTISPECIES: DUF1499 domain-containing protein [unclassified Phyllobacterium]MCO4318437.1 DUF1499 domain-containing protein [Phyllobacterium sp. 21LDTY02-6]MCX8281356.1 DUF1499 domain-containing protein [Phyllobacterium sp. 0TCS1.6C]MCX8295988.1 DUF1499 domain-containing protein [Phyllobacterium sp. 0TCS1.6A]